MKKIYPMCKDDYIAECGKGWYDIIDNITKEINKLNEEYYDDGNQIEIKQIKEKFGCLRYYISHGTEELYNLIHKAEEESYHTCEYCGSKEHIGYTSGWIRTMCKKCAEKNNFLDKWKEHNLIADGI